MDIKKLSKSHLCTCADWSFCRRWFVHLTICMRAAFRPVQFEMCTFEKLLMHLRKSLYGFVNTFKTNSSSSQTGTLLVINMKILAFIWWRLEKHNNYGERDESNSGTIIHQIVNTEAERLRLNENTYKWCFTLYSQACLIVHLSVRPNLFQTWFVLFRVTVAAVHPSCHWTRDGVYSGQVTVLLCSKYILHRKKTNLGKERQELKLSNFNLEQKGAISFFFIFILQFCGP